MTQALTSIRDVPYLERRLVVVVPDDYDSKQQVRKGGAELLKIAAPMVIGGLVLGPFGALLAGGAASGVKALADAVSGDQPAAGPPHIAGALAVPMTLASKDLQFPPAHPRLNHAYAVHPLRSTSYVPLAAFHSLLFEEKVNELMTLLAALGATRVRGSCSRGYRSSYGASVSASSGRENATLTGEAKSGWCKSATFEEHFESRRESRIPDGLLWLASEPSWQALAKRRLEFAMRKFRLQLSYEDSFGVDGSVRAAFEGVGVKVGGQFTDFESTAWDFEGEFA